MPEKAQPPVVDEAILEGYRTLQDEGQPDVIAEFIDLFLDDLPARTAAIRSAVAAGNADQIRSAAHALKGSAASIGAARLAAICDSLEAIARTGDASGSTAVLAALEPAIEAARGSLAEFRDRGR